MLLHLAKLNIYDYYDYRVYLKTVMETNRVSYKELADAIGVSKGVLHGLCGGRHKRNINRNQLVKIKLILNLTRGETVYFALMAEIDGSIITKNDRGRVLNVVRSFILGGGSTVWPVN